MVPVARRSVVVPVRQVSGGTRYTDRSVTLPVTQTGSLAALILQNFRIQLVRVCIHV